MVILQSHRTQNMILRCYPNVCAILWRHTKSCLLCFLTTIPIFPPFNSQNFLFTCLCSFFTCLQYCIQAGALLRPKNCYLVWSRGAVRTPIWRAPIYWAPGAGAGAEYGSCIISSSTVGRACSKKTASCAFFGSHGSKD